MHFACKESSKKTGRGPEALAEKRALGTEYVESLTRHLPMLRNPLFGMHRAADFIHDWISGCMAATDLLDVSGCLPGFVCLAVSVLV